jgi:hypothetical protein
MAKLMRCTEAHWQGNTFIPAGTVRPEGHRQVIPIYFEAFEVDEPSAPEPEPKRSAGKARKPASDDTDA